MIIPFNKNNNWTLREKKCESHIKAVVYIFLLPGGKKKEEKGKKREGLNWEKKKGKWGNSRRGRGAGKNMDILTNIHPCIKGVSSWPPNPPISVAAAAPGGGGAAVVKEPPPPPNHFNIRMQQVSFKTVY